jgi:hypothetical protein
MIDILDSMLAKPGRFTPESVAGYIALQLAKKLDDTDQLWKYRSLLDRHALPSLLEAFARAQASGLTQNELAAAFDEALSALTNNADIDAV